MLELRIMIRNCDIDRLRGLFAKRLIATMARCSRRQWGLSLTMTVFRKLRELDVLHQLFATVDVSTRSESLRGV